MCLTFVVENSCHICLEMESLGRAWCTFEICEKNYTLFQNPRTYDSTIFIVDTENFDDVFHGKVPLPSFSTFNLRESTFNGKKRLVLIQTTK